MLILGTYSDLSEGTEEVSDALFEEVYQQKLARVKEYRNGSSTVYCYGEETEAEVQTLHQLTNFDANLVYRIL
jgi:hypothetical protein